MVIKFSTEQLNLLKKMDIPFKLTGNLNESQILDLDTVVTDYLIEFGINEDESVNEEGRICENILKMLGEI